MHLFYSLYLRQLFIYIRRPPVTTYLIIPINVDVSLDISYSLFCLLHPNNYALFKHANSYFDTILNNLYLFNDRFLTNITGRDNLL